MVDVLTQLGSVTRELRTDERDGATVTVQSLEQSYPSPIDDVWDAVTTPERIARWFLPVSGDFRVGGRFQFEGQAGGEVLECNPPADAATDTADLRVTWEMGGVTWLTLLLTGEGERTRLRLEHVARTSEIPSEMWDTYGPGATGVGWEGGFLGLALHLGATEGSLAPSEAEAWAGTDEGRQFYRGAADAWASAHEAAGADPDTARRAADATYGFYTGT
ncbi:uncharacterized protein YndB with AHSA1/START domain [Knoellia remsis]|uniref:Uncharacterized protein YndB with AHSA1/START domain n=1 Tax=Knoellia remsis TaxID=407159 RepID=A0A2T0UGQ0_9MICO|nr:SRPBCC domain-containing protein [Knoellia remsis]PRY57054.1 uncharacterized protein YndB with AHSA1/START domain [Knoellia remsis]